MNIQEKKFTLYTKGWCPFCKMAVQILEHLNANFEEIEVSDNLELEAKIKSETGHPTVPMVFVDDEFIGGATELQAWLQKHGF